MFSLLVGWALIFHKTIIHPSLVGMSTQHIFTGLINTDESVMPHPCTSLWHRPRPSWTCSVALWLTFSQGNWIPPCVKKGKIRLLVVPSAACLAHIPLPLHQAVSFPMMLSYWNRESWTKDSLMMRWKRWSQGCCKRAKAQHVLDKSWSDIQLGCLDSIVLWH